MAPVDTARTGTAAPAGAPPPALSPRELGRWAWRQLTSMRTALVLLLLLALAAVPGSIIPQADVDAFAVSRWKELHPELTPVYESLGLFSVYESVWFSAIYILLVVSLVGCVLPRTRVYWRAMRARPPKAPRNLARLPEARKLVLDEPAETVLARAGEALRRKRYRIEPGRDELAGERGYLREAGNLLFHLSLLVVLVGFALGSLFGYTGGVIIVKGQGFSNSLSQYDDFAPGALWSPDDLEPFNFTVDDFRVEFLQTGEQAGMPTDFSADVTYTQAPGDEPRTQELEVNHPLQLGGGSVFLVGHGYAPVVTVRDGEGNVAYSGPAVFLPQDSSFISFGVIKAPDALPEQLAFEGLFLPTYGFTMETGPFSRFPDALDPVLSLLPYRGDLGLDSGKPQSVYSLDKDELEAVKHPDGRDFRLDIALGQTKTLPDGAGSITFDGVERWVKLQISDKPGKGLALGGIVLALLGLLGSLFIRPRRAWVRVRRERGRTVVELAGLDRSAGGDLAEEIDELEELIRREPAPHPTSHAGPDPDPDTGKETP
jgi:cytochrome c biogenesis protein